MQIIPTKFFNYKNNILVITNFFIKKKVIILSFIYILLFVLLYFFIDFSSQSLVAHDEGLYARRSQILEDSSNWFSPPFPSAHHKTIGSYWFIALSIRFFGNSELSLRLPSILTSFICLIISYLIALKITNKKSALISVFSLSSLPLWIKYSRYASPDIPFVLCILLVIYFFLKFLDTTVNLNKFFYIFISGLFASISFFLRSYMTFVPLIGLSPFFIFNLLKEKTIFRSGFFLGNLIGFIPTLLNLYFSYQTFGMKGIYSLFDFAKKQAVGAIDFSNYFFIPLNYCYLTFPIGILLIILIVFTKSNNYIKYPLLIYVYPLLSLTVLLSMSKSYPHYYLFLLPPLSILFAIKLEFNSFRFLLSKLYIKSILSLFIILISSVFIYGHTFLKESLNQYSYGNTQLIYLISVILLLSYISSIRFLYTNGSYQSGLTKFLYSLVIPQYVALSLLFNFGILGSPNYKTKSFLGDQVVSSIIKSNTIYLINVESKTQTLLSYYLPSSKVITNFNEIVNYDYIITSDKNIIYKLKDQNFFKSIKKFDNHSLLMNISN